MRLLRKVRACVSYKIVIWWPGDLRWVWALLPYAGEWAYADEYQ